MSFIGIDVAGAEEIARKLESLPDDIGGDGVESANKYLINIVRQYAPSHKGEPFQWSSDKQRRAAFANMRKQGGPPYRRTQKLRQGWQLLGDGKNQIIVNEVPYARYVKDPPIKGHAAREWTSIAQDVEKHQSKILAKFEEGVRKALKKSKLLAE